MYLERLNKELKKKGVKKKDMPNEIGISETSVHNYLTGKRVMPIDVFFNIISKYKLNIREVIESNYFIDEENKLAESEETKNLQIKILILEGRLDECRNWSKKDDTKRSVS